MNLKYQLTKETLKTDDKILYKIKALMSFKLTNGKEVNAGEYGGWIESTKNLSQDGNCWIGDNACVYGNALVCDNAYVGNSATVKDNAKIIGNAVVSDSAIISGSAIIKDYAKIKDNATISGHSIICDSAIVKDDAKISDFATICKNSVVYGSSIIKGRAIIGSSEIFSTVVNGDININRSFCSNITIHCDGKIMNSFIKSKNNIVLSGTNIFNNKKYLLCINDKNIVIKERNIIPINYLQLPDTVLSSLSIYNNYTAQEINILSHSLEKDSYVFFHSYAKASTHIKKKLSTLLKATSIDIRNQKVFTLLDYFVNDEDTLITFPAYRFVRNLINKVKELSDSNKTETIQKNSQKITEFLVVYVKAQILGIMLYGINICKEDNTFELKEKCLSWNNFLDDLLELSVFSINRKRICSFDNIHFVYNIEMINAIAHICGFSNDWINNIFFNLDSTSENKLKLYSE